jgi:hypothetical protein
MPAADPNTVGSHGGWLTGDDIASSGAELSSTPRPIAASVTYDDVSQVRDSGRADVGLHNG